jgi:biopolymer transport protein ExbB
VDDSVSLLTSKVKAKRKEAAMNWDLISMWHSMSDLAKGVVIILFFMCLRSLMVMINRGLRYSLARNQSRAFVQQVEAAMRDGKLDDAISIAERNKRSPIATLVAIGFAEFQSVSAAISDPRAALNAVSVGTEAEVAIMAAERSLNRTMANIHAELKRGLSGLATIGATAPFVGLFGTVIGITHAFRGSTGTASSALSGVASGIAEALVTTALGLLVAVPAVWCYNYFTDRVAGFDLEMQNSSMELVSYLAVRRAVSPR